MPTPQTAQKRPRLDVVKKTSKFESVMDLRSALRAQNAEGPIEALTNLRNQIAVKPQEPTVSPQDERLHLVKQWMESSPGAQDLFVIWDKANPRQSPLLALVVSIFSSVLTLLSSHYSDHAQGQAVMKTLLATSSMRRLNSYIGGSHNELIIVTLKLFNVMSNFSGGRDRKSVLEGFAWEIKSLPKLLNMRRKTHGVQDQTDPLIRPDIRSLYVLLLLSFVDVDNTSQTKTTFLEQHRDAFLALFKGIAQDHYSLARRVLEVCWAGIWSDAKLKRTLKIGLFNEVTIGQLIKLYERPLSEDGNEDHIPANLVHHFLLAICTRPGVGICFKDRGWYPRESEFDEMKEDEDSKRRDTKIYNKILANITRTLKVNEDSRQQELASKIMAACPELVAGYWSSAALTLEPRLSSKWISNIAFFGSIISLPVPSSSFYLPNSQIYQPTPPPLSTIIENILPSVLTKNHYSKGLLSASKLVQHCTALALCKCLIKYQYVKENIRAVAEALEEDEGDGQWFKRQRELEKEVRRRVPDFQVLVAFSQQKASNSAPVPAAGEPVVQTTPNPIKQALLAESSQRLLWLYHQCLPSVIAEARFDVGKLLQTFAIDFGTDSHGAGEEDDGGEGPDAASRLNRVRQLHVLKVLQESDQFVWTGKIGSLSRNSFYILLKALTSATIPAIHTALAALLQHVLSRSILFQEDCYEPDLWLKALPQTRPSSAGDEKVHVVDEAEAVITFVDDCVQRCLKTPYRYIEDLQSLDIAAKSAGETELPNGDSGAQVDRLESYPSPLLMTVIEQLDAKITYNLLSPFHVLGVASFVRKLMYYLSSKTANLVLLRSCAAKFDSILCQEVLPPGSPVISAAIRREVDMLNGSMMFGTHNLIENSDNEEVQRYLERAEQAPLPEHQSLRVAAAYELMDWTRTVGHRLKSSELRRLGSLVLKFHAPALQVIPETVSPEKTDLWDGMEVISQFPRLRPYLRFEWLYLHSTDLHVTDETSRTILVQSIFTHTPSLVDVVRVVHLLVHRIAASRKRDDVVKGHLSLLALITKSSNLVLPSADYSTLKEIIFLRPGVLKDVMMSSSSPVSLEGVQLLLAAALVPSSGDDRKLVSDISSHWTNVVKLSLEDDQHPSSISAPRLWIKFLEPLHLFDLMDFLAQKAHNMPSLPVLELITVVLKALRSAVSPESDLTFGQRLSQLLSLRPILPDSQLLEDLIAVAVETSMPVGLDGFSLPTVSSGDVDVVTMIRQSKARWSRRTNPLSSEIEIRQFLTQEEFSDSTVKIISGLLYRRCLSDELFLDWLKSTDCSRRNTEHLLYIFHAFLDSSSSQGNRESGGIWLPFMPRIVKAVADESLSPDIRKRAQSCILLILSIASSNPSHLLDCFAGEVNASSKSSMSLELMSTGSKVAVVLGSTAMSLCSTLADRGMQSVIDQSEEDYETMSSIQFTKELTKLIKAAPGSKAHLVETLLAVIIQSRLTSTAAVDLAVISLSAVQLKPLIVNRHLQGILQHPQFFKICSSTSPEHILACNAMIGLLHCLFHLHPTNTCQITHVEPLIRVYRGTLSTSDIRILSIFQLFESQRKLSVSSLLSRWSAASNTPSQSALESLQSLDPILVLRTCLNFPRWRRLEDQSVLKISSQDAPLYDPVFVMLLFSQMLADQPPASAFAWIELFRTNIISLFIRALSSKDGQMRELALCQVVALWKHIEFADLQEKPHVIHILNLLKDVTPPPSDGSPRRLPSYTTLILMHAFRGIFYPSNFIYPITARFLLQRPELDTADVPMLYGMLYSSSDDWKKERGWIIRFLSDGMLGTEDWRVLKRRHTWDLLASLYQSAEGDHALRQGILEVLANLTNNAQATTSLILKSALLSWIEVQILHSSSEGLEWIKVLENILLVVDSNKLEASTNGEWRHVISRCLSHLLDEEKSTNAVEIFPHATTVILRLALLNGSPLLTLPKLLDRAMRCLEQFERIIPSTSPTLTALLLSDPVSPSLHRSSTLHQRCSLDHPLLLWGSAVEALWRAAMAVNWKSGAWDLLTPKLLLWRSIVGYEGSLVGEWARVQVVNNIAIPIGG
ncbi:ribosome 60S biogenesis N-terminal-domain-containing protein [Crassisporium funariophilum]|nr:ribosome 60S biogenesis N-terminal-domain-containing protein [Crassisporium funariophilum]